MTVKTIIIYLLIFVGFHLLLYGFLRRRIAAAKRLQHGGDSQRRDASHKEDGDGYD
jgi:hypothetical protein